MLVVLTAVILARVYWVGTDTTYAASAGRQTTQTTELPRARGNFLDRTDRPLTGTDTTRYALCVPGDNSYSAPAALRVLPPRPCCTSAAIPSSPF